jgi:putative membrane protein
MVRDHETVIAMFEKAEGEVKDAELKKFITDTLPILKEHLAMAKKLPSGK